MPLRPRVSSTPARPRVCQAWFTVVGRAEGVDFDRDIAGDSFRSLTLGANLRPVRWAAFKLAWMRGQTRDRFNNLGTVAQAQLGLTSYF